MTLECQNCIFIFQFPEHIQNTEKCRNLQQRVIVFPLDVVFNNYSVVVIQPRTFLTGGGCRVEMEVCSPDASED